MCVENRGICWMAVSSLSGMPLSVTVAEATAGHIICRCGVVDSVSLCRWANLQTGDMHMLDTGGYTGSMNWTRLERFLFPTLRQSLRTWSPRARLLLRIALGLIGASTVVFFVGMSLVTIGSLSSESSVTAVGLVLDMVACFLLQGSCILALMAYAFFEA
jgi:hypothetical protein